jgi:hypothetical protein
MVSVDHDNELCTFTGSRQSNDVPFSLITTYMQRCDFKSINSVYIRANTVYTLHTVPSVSHNFPITVIELICVPIYSIKQPSVLSPIILYYHFQNETHY